MPKKKKKNKQNKVKQKRLKKLNWILRIPIKEGIKALRAYKNSFGLVSDFLKT